MSKALVAVRRRFKCLSCNIFVGLISLSLIVKFLSCKLFQRRDVIFVRESIHTDTAKKGALILPSGKALSS